MDALSVELRFFAGTLEVRGDRRALLELELPRCADDERTDCLRAPAVAYAEVLLALLRLQKQGAVVVVDNARRYEELTLVARESPVLRAYQEEALASWKKARGRGVVVLPTGAGKTEVALAAIADRQRSTLVVAPTLDLVRQWHQALSNRFDVDVGVVGGGEHTVLPLTVTTYDSAWAHMEHLGNRFGMIVFDECHHLVADSYTLAARLCLAPYRLGLSATPERPDGKDALLDELVGPIVARKEIDEIQLLGEHQGGQFLAEYDVVTVTVELSADERARYDEARATYKNFVLDQRISMGSPDGWNRFLRVAQKTIEGRQAFAAWRLQKRLATAAEQKLHHVDEILQKHRDVRVLVFSDDNATAYAVSRRFLVPVICHQTKVKERTRLLKAFSDGELPVLATSRVLNEGIDVPDAQVAVIVSGTGAIREHVQRLGRVLRPRPGKRAVLYELVSQNTNETFTSERRRDHVAYR
ncbi:MAG: DEAD/DEAH box helicase family protein [Deltaproteobacteria bacterium]|nr:DEAD/DEAH box helicase family protein [Deltaproteobacteria bacterium]